MNDNITNQRLNSTQTTQLLNVPYSEKDEAKKLGAKWNPRVKKWFVPAGVNTRPFLKWIDTAQADNDLVS